MVENKHKVPLIGITIGDFNGIGPEIILKVLNDIEITKFCVPIIYGSEKIFSQYRKLLKLSEENSILVIKDINEIQFRKINIINCWEDDYIIEPGNITNIAGVCSYLSLKRCTNDLKKGYIHGMVTAPINKENINSDTFNFIGHTEYLQSEFQSIDVLMFMISEFLKIAVVSMHVPVKDIYKDITKEKVENRLRIMLDSLKNDFGIKKPKVAVLGLNPHAGDSGMIGMEDIEILKPVIETFKSLGEIVIGPLSSDGFFAAKQYLKFDGILAMYHDQGLIPFKMLAFEEGVNFTSGLKVVRTSPDHGTAYDIAGKGIANENSFRNAIYSCIDIIKNRSSVFV